MIVDVHHHLIPPVLDDQLLAMQAEHHFAAYGAGARSERVPVTVEQIKQRLRSYAPDPGAEKLLRRMAGDGVDITLINVVDDVVRLPADEDVMNLNRRVAEVARRSGGRIVALAGIDPRRKQAPDMLRECVQEHGMRGLKWHPDHGYYPNSPEAYAMLTVAQELGVPLLTHTGPLPPAPGGQHRRAKYASAALLDEVAQDFPRLKIVAAHMGRFAWREWASLAQFRRNLYGDLAMWQIFAVASYERFCRDLREILDIAGTDAVMFGSDGPGFTALVPNSQFLQILKDLPEKAPAGIRFTHDEVEAILGGNAQAVFGL